MLNLKKYYKTLLTSSAELETKLGKSGKILSAYPNEVKSFPLIVYEDTNQNDIEFSDNLPEATRAVVRIHIFTKTLTNYPTTTEIGEIVHDIFRGDYWACTLNQETDDVADSIKHRVMDFTREFYGSL